MTGQALLIHLQQTGCLLSMASGELEIDAPDEVLTDGLIAQIRAHKAELLTLLAAQPSAKGSTRTKPTVWLRWSSLPEFCPLELCGGRLVVMTGRKDWATCAKCGIHFELERQRSAGVTTSGRVH